MEKVYVKTSRVLVGDEIAIAEKTLPKEIVSRSAKYKIYDKYVESLTAWFTLNDLLLKVMGKGLESVKLEFSTRGKPLIDDGYISLSHSGGAVAVCYGKTPCAIDIEEVGSKDKFSTVLKRMGLTEDCKDIEFFKRYTAVESVAKLYDKPFTENLSVDTENVKILEKNYENRQYVTSITARGDFEIL